MSSLNIERFITKSESVPVWHKVALSVDEMYAYTSIGRETIRGLTKLPEAKQFTIKIGKRTLIKRKRFEEFFGTNEFYLMGEMKMYKIDGTELYDYQQQLLQPPEEIPIWEKKCLTVEEAAAYTGIGERRLKALLKEKDCSFRIARSDQFLIIREKLEKFIDVTTEL